MTFKIKICTHHKQFFTWFLVMSMLFSGVAIGMPEQKPKYKEHTQYWNDHSKVSIDFTDVKQKQAYIKETEAQRKKFFQRLKDSKWIGGKKPSTMSDFYLLWSPTYNEPERLTEALKFMHQLQPRLRNELGVCLIICLKGKGDEPKILAATAKAGVAFPVVSKNESLLFSLHNLTDLNLVAPGYGTDHLHFPFSELDDSEAKDLYLQVVEERIKNRAIHTEKVLGKAYPLRFMPTYMRTHSTESVDKS